MSDPTPISDGVHDAAIWREASARERMRRETTRWSGRPGVAGRLLIAVLLPVTALAIAASVLLSERYDTASRAQSIARQIPALTGTVRLRTRLDQERTAAEASVRARELGIQIPSGLGVLGLTIEPQRHARAAVDAQLRALGSVAPPGFGSALAALRARIERGGLTGRRIDQGFAALSNSLAQVFATRLSMLERRVAGTPSEAVALAGSLRTLNDANEVLEADATETADISEVYLDPSSYLAGDIAALGGQIAVLAGASAHLRTDGREPVRSRFAALEHSASWQQFQAAAAGAVSTAGAAAIVNRPGPSVAGGKAQLLPLLATFSSGMTAVRQLYKLVGTAEVQTSRAAAELRDASTGSYRSLLIQTIVGVSLTILLALLLARSISRPLRNLERHARAVGDGDLELAPLQERGPRETVVATRAFNDLVSNLRLLEAKTRLLAECAFTDPLLSKRLPGALGRALEQSVAVLSGSIVERDRLQHRLAHEATHDALTGLHNRAAAVAFLDQAIARTSRSSKGLAVLFIDLDDFKRANDTHGHAVGDMILRTVAERMASAARNADFVARLGGDEFVVIAEGLTEGAEATAIAGRLVAVAGEPLNAGGVQLSIGACVGIAFALDGGADDSSQLLARADLALYRAKHANSRVEIYDESLQQALIARADVERDLRDALDAGGQGLFLHYQPVIDADSHELASLEALVRWERPGHGRCGPDDFIPAAEASDLIVQLDCWVLATALGQLAEWQRSGLKDVGISVNISGRHLLGGELSRHVAEALASSGVAPERLTLEITETVLLTDLPGVGVEMDRLRRLGVRLSIDDFGTGYTSLAHLQHLIVDEIKIDRSYAQQLPDGRDSPLVRLVTQAGHHLGVSIVAEGIETDEQLTALKAIGCDALQGYKIARPLTVEQLDAWRGEHRVLSVAEVRNPPRDARASAR
jgi:diguanylate cyclase (GGDEF)-like protein